MWGIRKRIAWKVAGGRPGTCATLLLFSALLSMVATGMLDGASTYRDTIRQGAADSFGGYHYQISGGGQVAREALTELVNSGQAVAVVKGRGSATASDHPGATTGTVLELSGQSRYGHVISGRHPTAPGELSISREGAAQAGVAVGGRVLVSSEEEELGTAEYTVTGITLNPASPSEVTMAAVTRSPGIGSRAQTWLTDTDPETIPALQTDLSSGNAQAGTVDASVRAASAEVGVRELAGLPWLLSLLFVVGAVGLAGVLISTRATTGRVASALVASGESWRRSWWVTQMGLFLLPVCGSLVGVMGTKMLMRIARGPLAAQVEQVWEETPGWLTPSLGFVGGYVMIALLVAWIACQHRPKQRHAEPRRDPPRWPLIAAPTGVVLSALLVYLYQTQVLHLGVALGTIVASIAWPVLLWRIPWLSRAPVQQRALWATTRNTVPTLNALMLLLTLAAYQSASLMSDVTSGMDGSESSMMVESLTANDVENLSATYPDIMADALVFVNADESESQPRATTAEGLSCFEQAIGTNEDYFTACPLEVLRLVVFAPSDGPAATFAGRVSEELSTDGDLGVVVLEPASGRVKSTAHLTTGPPDPEMGVNGMPDVVLDPLSPEVKRLGIGSSDLRTVIIQGFSEHTDREKNGFRTSVITQAGYSFVTESDSPEARQMRAMAFTIPSFAALIASIAVALLFISISSEQRTLWEVARNSGATSHQRLRLTIPLALSTVAATCVAVAMGRIGAMPTLSVAGTPLDFDYGWFWLIPVPSAAVTALIMSLGRMRTGATHGSREAPKSRNRTSLSAED